MKLDLILAERKIFELLCNRPINIDLKDNQGVTPLMIAAENGTENEAIPHWKMFISRKIKLFTGKPHIVDILLERGTDSSIKDDNGKRAIDYASDNGTVHFNYTQKNKDKHHELTCELTFSNTLSWG